MPQWQKVVDLLHILGLSKTGALLNAIVYLHVSLSKLAQIEGPFPCFAQNWLVLPMLEDKPILQGGAPYTVKLVCNYINYNLW